MPDATVQNIYDDARAHLADDQVSGGETYTNTVLAPFFYMAYRELYRVMQALQAPHVRNEAFYNLPANYGAISPAGLGITDLKEPEAVEERKVNQEITITGCTIAAGVATLTSVAHGYETGAKVVCWGVGGVTGLNGAWVLNKLTADTFTLLGSVASGTYTSGGKVSDSPDPFIEVEFTDRIIEHEGTAGSRIYKWSWTGSMFHFTPSTQARQLRITYLSSGTAPTAVGSSIGYDDARDFLAARTAALAAGARGGTSRALELNALALGPKLQADATGGLLRELYVATVRMIQMQGPIRRPPFRDVRSLVPEIY